MSGLLAQLPDLGELEQLRTLVQGGLDGTLAQVAGDPAGLIAPLTGALGPLTGPAPDLAGMLGPLAGQRAQLAGALPGGLDQQIAALLPLLSATDRLVAGSPFAPFLEDIRAGRSINDIAKDALEAMAGELLGALPQLTGAAVPPEAQAAIGGLTTAVGGLGGAPDPAALASVLAEHLLSVPAGPLTDALAARARLFDPLAALLADAGATVDNAEQTLVAQLGAAASRLETLDPTNAAGWQDALAALQQATAALATLHAAMQVIPGRAYGALGQIDLDRYKAELGQALAALPAGGPPQGRAASLTALAESLLEPLDGLMDALATTTPGDFTGRLRQSLDNLLALFDTLAGAVQDNPVMHLLDDLKQAIEQVAGAIGGVRAAIEGGLQALLAAVDAIAAEFDTIKQQVTAAFQALEDAITQLDVAALAQAVTGVLEQLDGALAAIPLADLKSKLDAALTTVEGLVTTLAEAAAAAIEQVERLAGTLDQLSFGPLVEPVIAAMDRIKDAIAAIDPGILPEPLRDQLHTIVEAFEQQFGGNPQQWFKTNVTDTLDTLFEKAVQGVRDLAESLQQKLKQFAETIGKLDPATLLAPVASVFQQLDTAIAGLSGVALLEPARALLDDAVAALREIAPGTLLAPIEQAFEREVLEPLARFKPSTLLAPLVEAFAPIEELLGKLDFSEALKGMGQAASEFLGSTQERLAGAVDFSGAPGVGGMAGEVAPVLALFKPATTIDEWTGTLDGVLNAYRPSKLLEPIKQVLAPVESALAGASDELLLATFGRLKGLASVASMVDTGALTSAFAAEMERIAAALEANQPATVIAGLSAGHARITMALDRIDAAALPAGPRAQYDATRAATAALDPATLAGLSTIYAGLPARFRQAAARTVDLSDLAAGFGARLSALTGGLPGFLHDELTPATIRAGLAAFSPTALIQQVDERFDSFLAAAQRFGPAIQAAVEGAADQIGQKLAALSPAALIERFEELFAPIRTAVAAISPGTIAAALDQTYQKALDKLALVHPKVIREPAEALFETVVGALEGLKTQLLDPVAAAIDSVLARIRATLKALDPRGLIAGLGNLFVLIRQTLDQIDLAALLDRLVQVFDRLRKDLDGALLRAAGAFGRMLEALPA